MLQVEHALKAGKRKIDADAKISYQIKNSNCPYHEESNFGEILQPNKITYQVKDYLWVLKFDTAMYLLDMPGQIRASIVLL